MSDLVDIAQVVTAVAAVIAVLYAIRLGERTLRAQRQQLAQYEATEGGAYCTNFRNHVIELYEAGTSIQDIRELFANELDMVRASADPSHEWLPPADAVRLVRTDDTVLLEAERNCGSIDEIVRLTAASRDHS